MASPTGKMHQAKLIGAVGSPRNTAGKLVPIMMDEAGRCFRIDRLPIEEISYSEINSLAEEGAVTLLAADNSNQSVPVDGICESADTSRTWAYVFYYSTAAVELLSPRARLGWDISLLLGKAEKSSTIGSNGESFNCYFVTRKVLESQLLPQLFQIVRRDCFDLLVKYYLAMRKGSEQLPAKFVYLADLLTDIAYDRKSAEDAIRYSGLALLHSPNASNFRAWLRAMLWHFNIPLENPEHWRDLSLGVLDEAVKESTSIAINKKYIAALSDPALREAIQRFVTEVEPIKSSAVQKLQLSIKEQRSTSIEEPSPMISGAENGLTGISNI